MANWTAEICTPYTGNGTPGDSYRPLLAEEHALLAWQDATGLDATNIIPGVNLYNIQITCTLAVLSAIEADPSYVIMWSEEISNGAT